MPTAQDVVDELLKPKNAKALGDALQPAIRTTPIDKDGTTLAQGVRQILAAQDPAKLAKAIAAQIGGSANVEAIKAALRAVFADAGDGPA